MNIKIKTQKNTYYDSVTLMRISKELKSLEGVEEVLVGMATDLNKELARNLGLSNETIEGLTVNDFFVTVKCTNEELFEILLKKLEELLSKKDDETEEYSPATLESTLKNVPDLNIAIISVPGQYAFAETKKALDNNLHVLLFSDNVSVKDEKTLKEIAKEKGLLMMGPDCGTAIINQVPLAFANVVKKGSIGIVGASGTGIQEASVLIDKFGGGVSQAIGTGGRDLSLDIGGIMMIEGIKALEQDEKTEVVLLISKPPAPEIAEKVLKTAKDSGKPFVVIFIGGDIEVIEKYGGVPALTLEDAAIKAVQLTNIKMKTPEIIEEGRDSLIKMLAKNLNKDQKYIRGLYTGGTLCDEAMIMLSKTIGDIYSNIPLKPHLKLMDPIESKENSCIDLGDDTFTVGRAHPMIDPATRQERLIKEAEDTEVAVYLMDFVLGYGSHHDPAGEMIASIEKAREIMRQKGYEAVYIASVSGTEADPQNLKEQERKLMEAGVVVMASNARAVGLAADLIMYHRKGRE
ncbi:acyl-CoA synthetase FdrA [Alkaliphilus peptidifermentans]|nr:acyl-CoA synthetase FdrA [Alkaliphilus peptidifermentans]